MKWIGTLGRERLLTKFKKTTGAGISDSRRTGSFPGCTLRGAGGLQEEVHTREAEAEARPRPGVTLRAEGGARAPMYSSR